MKRFRNFKNVGIVDELTGKTYTNNRSLCNLLNSISDKSDSIAEDYYKLKFEGMSDENKSLYFQKIIYEDFGNSILKIMVKYNIDSLEKLDKVLFNARIW
jgi:hypothetical protein